MPPFGGSERLGDRPPVLVVAPPNRHRDSLVAVVRAVLAPDDDVRVSDAPSVLGLRKALAPSLVLLDTAPASADAWVALACVKAQWPNARTIVLADDSDETRQAAAYGSDAVLMKGCTYVELAEAINQALGRGLARRD